MEVAIMDLDRTISIIIVIILIMGLVGIVYITLNNNEEDKLTEFYLLGENGKANDYPTNLSVNQEGNLTVGVVNQEHSTSSYLLKITQNSSVLKEENITLKDGEKLEIPFEFTAGPPGEYKLEFDLYKLPDTENIYRSLYLVVNVK